MNSPLALSDICKLIVDCEHKTAPTQDEGFPSIRTPNLGRGYFLLDGVRRVSEDTYNKWTRRAVPQYGDLILAREAPVGNVAMVPRSLKPCLGQRTLLLRPDTAYVNPRYLTFLLVGDELQGVMHGMASGATVPHLNMKDVRELQLPPLPSLPTQHKIAAILSAYDDLIENNTRRIAILEEMAQAIYREWFVNFRFPGHENVKHVDSPLGQIPDVVNDWRESTLGQLCEFTNGGAWNQSEYSDAGLRVARVTNFVNGTIDLTDCNYLPNSSFDQYAKNELFEDDLVVATVGSHPSQPSSAVGRSVRVPHSASGSLLNQNAVCIRPLNGSEVYKSFLLLFSRTDEFRHYILANARGSASQARMSIARFKEMPVRLPSVDLSARFDDIANTLLRQISSLERKNDNLRTTRDLLLPKLTSGKLDVEDLDIDVGMSAEALDEATAS